TEVRRILRRTLGFTLIELLVVIAIIAVLIALLLPAIQAAREAARRADCTNRLKQFGLAISNYYDVNGMLPPADVHDWGAPHTVFATRHYHTMYSFILPYMGQQPLYDSINYDYPPRYEAGWPGDPSGSN